MILLKDIKIFSLLMLLTVSFSGYSQVEGIQNNNPRFLVESASLQSVTSIVPSTTLSLNINKPVSALKHKTVYGKLYLKLDLGEDLVIKTDLSDLDVSLDISYKLTDGTTSTSAISKTIQIVGNRPERLEIEDLTNQLGSYTDVEIEIVNINNATTSNSYMHNLVTNNLRLTATFVREYAIDVRLSSNDLLAPALHTVQVPTAQFKRRSFSWYTNGMEYPNYEIQILRVFNEKVGSNLSISQANDVVIDWEHALKIETQSYKKEIDLIIAEGAGWYTWRVRPIGNYYEGGIGNSNNYGKWSLHHTQNFNIDFVLGINYSFYIDTTDEVDDQKNWSYSRVFTEGDKTGEQGVRTSEGISYADGLLRTRQSQAYNSSNTPQTITSQTISDYSGRPALTTLPIPESGDLEGYKENFITTPNGDLYSAKHFDADGNYDSPTLIEDAPYYHNNPNGVANSEGFGFSRTLFKTDGTGRPTETSGVGQAHSIGSRNLGRGRTTRYLYSSPSDAELIRIFGNEAPLAESVIRTITIDPNDVISVTYTSKEGKTIATAMITNSTDNLEGLDNDNHGFVVNNSTDQNVLVNDKFVSSKRIAITGLNSTTQVTLGYDVGGFSSPCREECDYKVRFYLRDLSDGTLYESELFTVSNGLLDFVNNWAWEDVTDNLNTIFVSSLGEFNLTEGEYIVTKEVYSSKNKSTLATSAMERADAIEEILLDVTDRMALIDNNTELDNFIAFIQTNASTFYSYPSGFSLGYDVVNSQLTISDVGEFNNGSGGQCASCETSTVKLPKEFCLPCVGADGTGGIKNIIKNKTIPLNSTEKASVDQIVEDHFMSYLEKQLDPDGILTNAQIQEQLVSIAPGFTMISIKYMLRNMLISKYYTGKSELYGATRYQAIEDENGVLVFIDVDGIVTSVPSKYVEVTDITNLDYNYDCEELFNCWRTAVNLIKSLKFENDVNIMSSYNDSEGDGASGNGAAEDEADSDDAQEGSGGGAKLLDFIISYKMRKFNDEDGALSEGELNAMVSLPLVFMECAGYQFAEILDDEYVADPSLIPGEYNDLVIPSFTLATPLGVSNLFSLQPVPSLGTKAPMMMDFPDDNPAVSIKAPHCGNNTEYDMLNYPYILKPEWMFKYFVYNAYNNASIPDANNIIINQLAMEVSSTYNLLNACTSLPLCFEENSYYHESWSSGQRLNFYQMIRGGKKKVDECENSTVTQTNPVDLNLTETDLLELTKVEIEDALFGCEARAGEIESQLVVALENACYEIVDCNSALSAGQISELGVVRMVNEVIDRCKSKIYDEVAINIFADQTLDITLLNTSNYKTNGVYGPYIYGPNNTNPSSTSNEYPYYEIIECCYSYPDPSGGIGSKDISKRIITLFPECDQTILDQMSSWNFIPYIAPLAGCTNVAAAPEWSSVGGCNTNAPGTCGEQICTDPVDPANPDDDIDTEYTPTETIGVNGQ